MNNLEMAKSYERQAQERLKHAREALGEGNYPYVVRYPRKPSSYF